MPYSDKFDSLNGTAVVPGDKIVKCEPMLKAGRGCSVMHSCIYSTTVGYVSVRPIMDGKSAVVQVEVPGFSTADLPRTGSLVSCRVLRATSSYAECTILAVANKPLRHTCNGLINNEAIHSKQKEKTNLFVRERDIVVAKVVGQTEAQVYLLSIKDRSLGVMFGYCYLNHKMYGCSDRAIRCEECCIEDERKVAIASRPLSLSSLSLNVDERSTNGHVTDEAEEENFGDLSY